MGRSLRSKFYRRALVSFRKAPSHQPIRNEGGSSGSAILQDRLQEQSSPYRLRQHLSGGLYQQTGQHKISKLCALMWRILTWCQLNNVTLRARHVPGSLNVIADGFSRRNQIQSTEWSLSPQIFKQISKLWESPQVDLFATSLNKKLPTYVSLIPDPQAWEVDALNIPWENMVAYAFPPTTLLPKVVQKLQSQTCRIILIAPGWPTKPWFWDLVEMSGHSKTTTTHTHSAKTTTEQPLPCQPNIPEPPRLVSRSSALQEHGFTAEVAERIAAPQRLSTRSLYTSKWTVFQRWCTEKQVDFRSPSIGDICNFFWYLFND